MCAFVRLYRQICIWNKLIMLEQKMKRKKNNISVLYYESICNDMSHSHVHTTREQPHFEFIFFFKLANEWIE